MKRHKLTTKYAAGDVVEYKNNLGKFVVDRIETVNVYFGKDIKEWNYSLEDRNSDTISDDDIVQLFAPVKEKE